MNLNQIRIFRAIVKHRNFTRAAEELRISQPSVSVQIRNLEEELGIDLFEQLGKKLYLTEAGRLFDDYALKIIRSVEEALEALNQHKGIYQGDLKIGASTTPGIYLLPMILGSFRSVYPEMRLSLAISNSRTVEEKIFRNEIDIGFVGVHSAGQALNAEPFMKDEIVLITAPTHRLALLDHCTLSQLEGEKFIMREPGSATRVAVERAMASVNFQIAIEMEIGNPEAIKQAVAAGLGLSLLSKFAVREELQTGCLKHLAVEGLRIERDLHIIYHKDKHLTMAAQSLLKMAKEFPAAQFVNRLSRNQAT